MTPNFSMSSPNTGRFSKSLHWNTLWKILNNVIEYSTMPPHLNCVAGLPCETLVQEKLTIAAVSSCPWRLFGRFKNLRPRSLWMIRTTLGCVIPVSLDIWHVQRCVYGWFPCLVLVHQQRSAWSHSLQYAHDSVCVPVLCWCLILFLNLFSVNC